MIVNGDITVRKVTVGGDISTGGLTVGGNISLPVKVPYEGDYTITPTEAEQTIPIKGKFATQDITVEGIPADYVGSQVPRDVAPTIIGNEVRIPASYYPNGYRTGVPYSWMGEAAEWLETCYPHTQTALADTSYATWTPSTTAKAIKATATAKTYKGDTATYDYLLRWRFWTDVKYAEGTVLKAAPDSEFNEIWQVITKRAGSFAQMDSGVYTTNACATMITVPLLVYYNTSGTRTFTYSTSYGFYASATAATFSNATTDAPTITIKTPAINARCNSTYFATGMGSAVDQTNTKLHLVGDLYRCKAKTSAIYNQYDDIVMMYEAL